MSNKLQPKEQFELKGYEKIIAKGMDTFKEVGAALITIRDRRLYRENHGSFNEYLEARWNVTRQRAHQLIQAADSVKDLPPEVSTMVDNERAARELSKVEPKKREAVVRSVVAAGKPVTSTTIKAERVKTVDAEEVYRDAIGREVPKNLWPLWNRAEEVQALLDSIDKIKRAVVAAHKADDLMYREVNNTVVSDLDRAYHAIQCGIPYAVCTDCQGHPESQPKNQCRFCYGRGLISKHRWRTVPEEKRAIIEKGVKK